jgi:PAS domain S-box-containing protein
MIEGQSPVCSVPPEKLPNDSGTSPHNFHMTSDSAKPHRVWRGMIKSLALGLFVFYLGRVFAVWLTVHNVHGFLAFLDNVVAAIAAVVVALLYERAQRHTVDALRESEAKYRAVVDLTNTGYLIADSQGRVLDANQEYVRLSGHGALSEILGRNVSEWTTEGAKQRDAEAWARCAKDGFIRNFYTEYVDGKGRETSVAFNATVEGVGQSVRILGLCRDVTEPKRYEQAIQRLTGRLINAQEEERCRIARELHDDIGQRIALLLIELGRWKQQLPDSEVGLLDRIHRIRQGLSKLSTDIQALSHGLHSSQLEYLGIVAAANSLCEDLSENRQVWAEFIHSDMPRNVPGDISLCLFRVLQEALQNAVKHSGARHIKVELRGTSDGIQLTVGDSGSGFDMQEAINRRGLGLISMRERLGLVNGQLTINSAPGCGTTILARVPFSSGAEPPRAEG